VTRSRRFLNGSKLNKLLRGAILPTGFVLLFYAATIDHFRNPAIFSGAITLLTLPAVHTLTKTNGDTHDSDDESDDPPERNGRSLEERALEAGRRARDRKT
jgi:hypothetical protein